MGQWVGGKVGGWMGGWMGRWVLGEVIGGGAWVAWYSDPAGDFVASTGP